MESICDVSMKSRDVDSLQTIVIMCVEKGECEPQYVVYQKHVFYTIYCGFKGLQNLHSPVRIRVAPPKLSAFCCNGAHSFYRMCQLP